MRCVRHVAHTWKRRGAYIVLMAKPDGKVPLGKPRHILEVDIKMNPTEIGWGAWTGLIWLRIGTSSGCGKHSP
jgi:hypothetical protein